MSYSRSIDGVKDARALAAIFRRVGAELRRERHAAAGECFEWTTISPAPAEIKPDGQGATELKQGAPLLRRPACADRCRQGQRPARGLVNDRTERPAGK